MWDADHDAWLGEYEPDIVLADGQNVIGGPPFVILL
jgi:hypothetical protein